MAAGFARLRRIVRGDHQRDDAPRFLAAHPAGAGGFAQPSGYPEADYADDGGYGNGYPGQAPYADSYGSATAGYVPSYSADGYPAEQYGQDGYGGYPDGQG